jgi:DNA-binding NtrC family response regulator
MDKRRKTPTQDRTQREYGLDTNILRAPLLGDPPPKKDKWLISWIGGTDLTAARTDGKDGEGPIAAALKGLPPFDRVLLLTNYDADESSRFVDWLKARGKDTPIDMLVVPLKSPIDYSEIYEKITAQLSAQGLPNEKVELTYHLSPGTPAMIVNWILLARTLFPAKLIQTSKGQLPQTVDMPLRLAQAFRPRYNEGRGRLAEYFGDSEPRFNTMVYRSQKMREVVSQAHKLAQFGVSVLIYGETGTGKDLLAKEIHVNSRRANGPYVPVNCGALTVEMANSELFGHVRGAFTGAVDDRPGCFERADGGTLFLDEIAELPLDIQVRLLRVLADGEVTPVGGTRSKKVNVRIIAASHRNLADEVAKNRFREDLYYRLAVGQVALPPLRGRGEDVEALIRHFITQFNTDDELNPAAEQRELSAEAMRLLLAHSWPGNVRELYHTIVRLSIRSDGELISAEDVRQCLLTSAKTESSLLDRPLGPGFVLQDVLDEVSRHYLKRASEQARGQRKEAASLLGFGTPQSYVNWRKKLIGE